jgi:hypothetical protein
MAVANGQDAGLARESLVRGNMDQDEFERTRKALLDFLSRVSKNPTFMERIPPLKTQNFGSDPDRV